MLDQLVRDLPAAVTGAIDTAALRRSITLIANVVADAGGGDWFVHEDESFCFAAFLYGVTLGGGNITLLPDTRATTLAEMECRDNRLVGSHPEDGRFVSLDTLTVNRAEQQDLPARPPGRVLVLTSGSSGARKVLSRNLHDLLSEATSLEAQWLSENSLATASMVSHHHMYGLMFGIVWPLSRGVPVINDLQKPVPNFTSLVKGEIQRVRLISSPTYIHRFKKSLGLASFEDRHGAQLGISQIFSAGAPLQQDRAQEVAATLNCAVEEVYGSSETGAVATRRADIWSPWQPLPRVDIKVRRGCLLIDAPYLAAEVERPFPSADRAVTRGSGFKLQGRVDRIVKIEGKRISLQQVEDAVSQLEWVDACSSLVLQAERVSIALAIVLNELGLARLLRDGKPKMDKCLRRISREGFDAVLIPRRIRYLAELPLSSQGKVDIDRLKVAFTEGARRQPSIIRAETTGERLELELGLDPDLMAFDGHFPGFAVLPGVALVHWVMAFGQQYLGVEPQVSQLPRIKFTNILCPEDTVRLIIERTAEQLSYVYTYSDQVCAKGTLVLDA